MREREEREGGEREEREGERGKRGGGRERVRERVREREEREGGEREEREREREITFHFTPIIFLPISCCKRNASKIIRNTRWEGVVVVNTYTKMEKLLREM